MDTVETEPQVVRSAFDSPTFDKDGSFRLDKPVGSMSISPCGRDVVLASRQGLHIIDLDTPWAPPRHLPHHTPWEVADVQWSPFAIRDYWVVSTSNQKALVWNLGMSLAQGSIEHVLHAHSRAITDINFSAFHPDILATCAVDSFVHCWDLRHPARPAITFCDWFAGATQVKWNRQDSHIIASSHDKYLRIWDDRKGAHPFRSIAAHDTKIYGVDWNRTISTEVVTCSLDRTVKFWDYGNDTDEPQQIIQTPFPIWRARHTPFGEGVLAMPQRGDNDLHLYDYKLGNTKKSDVLAIPVHQFEGHEDQVKEFLWRPRGTIHDRVDDREFQLVTWGADRMLRLHRVTEEICRGIGYLKGKETDRKPNLTRRDAVYQTFREAPSELEGEIEGSPSFPRSRILDAGIGMKSALSLGMNKAPIPATGAWSDSGFMSSGVGTHGKAASRKDMDPIAWMKGVKIGKKEQGVEKSISSLMSPTLKADKQWDIFESLGEEITHVGDKFSNVVFDEINVQGRLIRVSMPGPWGRDRASVYVQSRISFPTNYPGLASPLTTIERTTSINAETASRIQVGIDSIFAAFLSQQKGCLEALFRFLQGEQTAQEIVAWFKSDHNDGVMDVGNDGGISSSDEEDDDIGGLDDHISGSGLLGVNNANANVPLPKACGALWADDGRLVCFFPPKEDKNLSILDSLVLDGRGDPLRGSKRGFEGFGSLHTSSPMSRLKFSKLGIVQDEGYDSASESDESSASSSASSSTDLTQMRLARKHYDIPSAWRETGLDVPRVGSLANESLKSSGNLSGTRAGTTNLKNYVSIHDCQALIPAKRTLGEFYTISRTDTCAHNARVAGSMGEHDLADTWLFVDMIVRNSVPLELVALGNAGSSIVPVIRQAVYPLRKKDSAVDISSDSTDEKPAWSGQSFVRWGESPLGSRGLIQALFSHFERLSDVQMLAMLACVFSETGAPRRSDEISETDSQRTQADNGRDTRFLNSLAGSAQPALSWDQLHYYFPTSAVARSLLSFKPMVLATPKSTETLKIDLPSVTSSLEASGSDPITPYSTGGTPPLIYKASQTHFDRSEPSSKSLSSSPENYRHTHRSNSNLASAFAASLSRPFSFTTSASSSPPGPIAKKGISPVGSYITAPAQSVTWAANSIFGKSSGYHAILRPIHLLSQPDHEDNIITKKTGRSIKVNLKNQDKFHNDGYAVVPLLDPREERLYSYYRASYANLLADWDLPLQRAEVLKYNKGSSHTSDASFFTSSDSATTSSQRHLTLRSANTTKPLPLACIFCAEAIHGLSSPCLSCGHILHATCRAFLSTLPDALNDFGVCLSGCSCACHTQSATGSVEITKEAIPETDLGYRELGPGTQSPGLIAPTIRAGDDQEEHGWYMGYAGAGYDNDMKGANAVSVLAPQDPPFREDIAYESLAKNLGLGGVDQQGRRALRPKGSQIWRGDSASSGLGQRDGQTLRESRAGSLSAAGTGGGMVRREETM